MIYKVIYAIKILSIFIQNLIYYMLSVLKVYLLI